MQAEGSQRYPSYVVRRVASAFRVRSPPDFTWTPCQTLRKLSMTPSEGKSPIQPRRLWVIKLTVRLLRTGLQRMGRFLEKLILKPETILIGLDGAGGFYNALDPGIHSELSELMRGE